MAESLRTRYVSAGADDKDLEESVELSRKTLQVILPSHSSHYFFVDGLAKALVLQFRANGDLSHLEEASQLYHDAGNIMSIENPWRPDNISNYAYSLGLRFGETGDISELNRAVDLDTEAVDATNPSAMNDYDSALQMVSHLCLRFEALQDHDDLNKAITVVEALLKSLPVGNINRLEAINIFAKAHILHAIDRNNLGDIDFAIEQFLSIKDKLSQSNLGPESLRTLAACYLIKFRHSSSVHAALCASDAMNEVLESVSSNHYERFQCLIDAAKLYMERGTPYYNIDIALKYFSDALENIHKDVRSKIRGAKDVLSKLELEHHDIFTTTSSTSLTLLGIIESAVLLLPRVAFFGIHPYSRLQSLQEGQSIAMTGASYALHLSLLEKALEIMEQGRAIFWTHTLRLRSPFDDIPKHLQDQLFTLARRLEKVVNTSEDYADQQYIDTQTARRRKESEEFNSLAQQVRCLPGLERFMLPDSYSTLKCVVEKGPVVVLVNSTLACHAIILRSSCTAASIPLTAVTDKWLVESALIWRSRVVEARSALRDERKLVKVKKAPDSSHAQSERILRLLWTNVVFPVIQALRIQVILNILHLNYRDSNYNKQPALERDRPRVWWCPTGCFAHLPIHAAGADGKWCSDYIVSSYTPTLSSLRNARKEYTPVRKQNIKALVAAVPRSFSPLWRELASTIEEVGTVKEALPDKTIIPIPGADDIIDEHNGGVTAGALLDKLPEATILHLACHGRQDPDNALNSGFVMSDEMLTIERLMRVPLPRAFMAFLSACETAKGDQVSVRTGTSNSQCTDSDLPSRISLIKLSTSRRPCCLLDSRV
jgi:tetratricopeptide (TPR) repeat protein